jgi:small subunit ribosomal protein S3
MGQKVHPLGFRVGITKKHQSQWFARFTKYAYAQSVVEDHMLRKNLINLFPDLLSPVLKKTPIAISNREPSGLSADSANSFAPKVTQIQIERGLIPYEIGIQIHSSQESCELIQAAIDNLKINRQLFNHLQKTRNYLSKVANPASYARDSQEMAQQASLLGSGSAQTNMNNNVAEAGHNQQVKKRTFKKALGLRKLSDSLSYRKKKFSYASGSNSSFSGRDTKAGGVSTLTRGQNFTNSANNAQAFSDSSGDFGSVQNKFSKADNLTNNLKNRLIYRQSTRDRYFQFLAQGLVIRKKGNQILRKVSLQNFVENLSARDKNQTFSGGSLLSPKNQSVSHSGTKTFINKLSNKLSKKFATLFVNKLNRKFLISLKALMKYWYNQSQQNNNWIATNPQTAPLGFSKKWSLNKLKTLQNKPISNLSTLVDILEKKSLQKLESLRKDFFTFGTISKTRSFGYYQLITFLKQLKELINKLKKQTKPSSLISNKSFNTLSVLAANNDLQPQTNVNINIFSKVVNNLDNECRKVKFISYLQNLVKKHRHANLFYYLSSMAVASKDLKQLKRYTKKHASFLFGVESNSLSNNAQQVELAVKKVLAQSVVNNSLNSNKTLQEAYLEQVENQRRMYKSNLALTPKVSIKFFAINNEIVLEKASVVADTIVDALEKRKAFRGVIKKAKEDLMRRPRVKGVKIQVSGRLNGAEIARSEWVRAGRVPLQTLRANIDYSYRTASTIYGIIGVKVWIFKGYY